MFQDFNGMNRHARRAALRKARKEAARRECGVTTHQMLRRQGSGFVSRLAGMVERFGYPPQDREIAVAHEAGHLVVGAALGGVCVRAYVREDEPGVWIGFNAMNIPQVNDRLINVRKDPARAAKWAIYLVAGIAAEMVIGRFHPASSFEEATMVGELSAALAVLQGERHQVVAADIFAAAVLAIRRNIKAFDALRAIFAASETPDPAVINQVLRDVVRLNDLPACGGAA